MTELPETEDAAPAVKVKATKEELEERKKYELTFRDIMTRPFMRRLNFWYVNPETLALKDYVVLGDIEESKIMFGSPSQSVGVIYIKDADIMQCLCNVLDLFELDLTQMWSVQLTSLATALNKIKYDLSKLSVVTEPDGTRTAVVEGTIVELVKPVEFLPGVQRIASHARSYIEALNAPIERAFCYPYEHPGKGSNAVQVSVSHAEFKDHLVGQVFPSDINMIVIKGLDLLDTKPFSKHKTISKEEACYKFLPISNNVLIYTHVCRTDKADFMVSRCDLFLVPRTIEL